MIVLFPPSKSRRIAARRPRLIEEWARPRSAPLKKAAQNAQIVSLPGQTAFAEKRGAMVARAEQIVALLLRHVLYVIEGLAV